MTCNKESYTTRGRANLALQTIRKRGARVDKKPTRSYLCPSCGRWHLTSQPQ